MSQRKQTARAKAKNSQPVTADSIDKLTKEMYRLYPTRDTANFMRVSEKLKEASRKAGDERTFYKAWGNQAMYTFLRISQQRGIKRAQEVYKYALKVDSKFGMYTSTYLLGSIRSSAKNEELARKSFLEAVDLHHKYFPNQSAAAAYLGLCKSEYNHEHYDKVLEYAESALREPGVIPVHQVTAWTYKCLVSYSQHDSLGFENNYKKRHELMEKYHQGGAFGTLIELYKAYIRKDYDKALKFAMNSTTMTKSQHLAKIYELTGNYKDALHWYRIHTKQRDSIYTAESRAQISEFGQEMELAQAESEAKNLQLANQLLRLEQVSDELRRKALEAEKKELALKNADMELANAVIRFQNDSLERSEQAAKLKEYQSHLDAMAQSDRARRTARHAAYTVGGIILLAVSFFFYRRQKQMRHLEQVNQQLRVAYDQLEEATAARERIESELRIARNIQMSVLPHNFPDRPDLDMYAMMTPAKEVGGDLYNYELMNDKLYFCVGDVSGKGVPASLFMAEVSRMFCTLVEGYLMPNVIATRLNRAMTENNDQGMFVTMFIGLIDLKTGHMDFCNAGHNPPLLDGAFMEMEPNAPIGLWEDLEYVGEEVSDLRGKTLFIYTDGLNEAENIRQEQFGDDRLQELLTHHYGTAQQTSEAVHEAVEEFVGEAAPSDDLTKMCIKLL